MQNLRALARLTSLWLLITAAGCLPYRANFLRLGVTVITPRAGPPTAYLLLDELGERMPAIDLADVAFYFRGREPLPFTLLDSDDDGLHDLVRVTLPEGADQRSEHWIVVVSPR